MLNSVVSVMIAALASGSFYYREHFSLLQNVRKLFVTRQVYFCLLFYYNGHVGSSPLSENNKNHHRQSVQLAKEFNVMYCMFRLKKYHETENPTVYFYFKTR